MLAHRLNGEISLELLEERHAEEIFRVVDTNRAHLREWLPWLDGSRSVEESRAFIRRARGQLANNDGFHTPIRYRGNLVGMLGLHSIDWHNRSTSLGYWLAREAQGLGIMTACCAVYLGHAYEALKLHRVEIRCAVANRRSRAVAERLGFREEGQVRQAEWLYDHFVDNVVYGLLAPEWSARLAAR